MAIVFLAISWGLVMHSMGWSQTSTFAQTRALEAGQAEIDPWHWETMDKAWVNDHFYSVKAPGLALLSTPAYAAIEAAGGHELSERAAANARATPNQRWVSRAEPPYRDHGYSAIQAKATGATIENNTAIIWALALLTAVVPAVALLLLVRWVADRFVPGYGTAAAITLGVATLLMTFAAEYMSHTISATLGFAAFALLLRERDEWRERESRGRLLWVGLAGLLAGLAIAFEYPLGIVGVVLFFYALGPGGLGPRLRRGGAYALGGIAGALPLFAFNAWAVGSPTEFAYSAAVAVQGLDGHAAIGLNSDGFFGITLPRPADAFRLLFAGRGLITLTPVLAAAFAGLVLMRRAPERRAELRVIAAVAIAFFLYNSGYWLPFGGGTPGPRFLIPILPFLAVGLAYAYRAIPAITLGLAIPSALIMVVASLTHPLIGEDGTGLWAEMLVDGTLEHTVLTALGVADPWLAVLPVLAAVGAAAWFAAASVPPTPIGDVTRAAAVVVAWMAVSVLGPVLAGDPTTTLERPAIIGLVGIGGVASVLTLVGIAYRQDPERDEPARRREVGPRPAYSERSS